MSLGFPSLSRKKAQQLSEIDERCRVNLIRDLRKAGRMYLSERRHWIVFTTEAIDALEVALRSSRNLESANFVLAKAKSQHSQPLAETVTVSLQMLYEHAVNMLISKVH